MTYENASEWLNEHFSKDNYDEFEDWLGDGTVNSENGLMTPNLLNNPTFVNMMKGYWDAEIGSYEREEDREYPATLHPIEEMPSKTQRVISASIMEEQPREVIQYQEPIRVEQQAIPQQQYQQPVIIQKKGFTSRISEFFGKINIFRKNKK